LLFHKRLALLLGLLLHFTDCTSCALTLLFYRPRSCNLFLFRCPRAQPSVSRYVRREPVGSRSLPHSYSPVFSCKIGISSNFLVFSSDFLVFSSMVATSGGWCGTKLGLFWFHSQKSCGFAFRLLNNDVSYYFSYILMIIIILNLNSFFL